MSECDWPSPPPFTEGFAHESYLAFNEFCERQPNKYHSRILRFHRILLDEVERYRYHQLSHWRGKRLKEATVTRISHDGFLEMAFFLRNPRTGELLVTIGGRLRPDCCTECVRIFPHLEQTMVDALCLDSGENS